MYGVSAGDLICCATTYETGVGEEEDEEKEEEGRTDFKYRLASSGVGCVGSMGAEWTGRFIYYAVSTFLPMFLAGQTMN